jgi:hypothetical protein
MQLCIDFSSRTTTRRTKCRCYNTLMTVTVLWVIFAILFGIFGIFSTMLIYHWRKYSIFSKLRTAAVIYFTVAGVLFISMAMAIAAMPQ